MSAVAGATVQSCVITRGRKCITYTLTDGAEMVEEYDVVTDELLLRKLRTRNTLGGYGTWQVEVGSERDARASSSSAAAAAIAARELLVEAGGTPEVVRQETAECHVIRIRNLPYDKDNYSIGIERAEGDAVGEIVVRTRNRKYYKRLALPAMRRAQLPLDASQLRFDVKHNTLVIEYKKHLAILAAEAAAKKQRAALPARRLDDANGGGGDGAAACAQQ